MEIVSARLAYAPFKRKPAGHVFVIFRTSVDSEIVISPEADVAIDDKFSLLKGMTKTYPLRYQISTPGQFLQQYKNEGRRVYEYPLDFTNKQLSNIYADMLTRARVLEERSEWYHTIFNSCITNLVRHIDDVQSMKLAWLRIGVFVLKPEYGENL
jgi:hypothetical protein